MSNTLTDLKDVKVAQSALLPWMNTLVPVTSFSTNFTAEPAARYDTVRVPVIGAATESSDFDGDYTDNSDSEASSVPVVLNKHKYKTVKLSAKEAATTAFPLLEKLVVTAATRLAQDVMKDILSCVTEANFGDAALDSVSDSDFTYSDVLALRGLCGKADMPIEQRSLLLDCGYYNSLLGDSVVAQSSVSNIASPAIKDAQIQRVAGFTLYETTCIPDNDENLAGFAVHPSAIAVAMRYLEPVAAYDEAGAITDPVTGLTFGYLRYSDPKSGLVYITLEALYGYAVTRTDALKRIVKPVEVDTDDTDTDTDAVV